MLDWDHAVGPRGQLVRRERALGVVSESDSQIGAKTQKDRDGWVVELREMVGKLKRHEAMHHAPQLPRQNRGVVVTHTT